MAKKKAAKAWAIVDPKGDFRAVTQFRSTAISAFTRWSETMNQWICRDEHPDAQKWAGLTWKQAYRKGWRCVKVWVYSEPMVDKYFKTQYNELLEMTRSLDEHPEDYNGPCECKTCMSYAD